MQSTARISPFHDPAHRVEGNRVMSGITRGGRCCPAITLKNLRLGFGFPREAGGHQFRRTRHRVLRIGTEQFGRPFGNPSELRPGPALPAFFQMEIDPFCCGGCEIARDAAAKAGAAEGAEDPSAAARRIFRQEKAAHRQIPAAPARDNDQDQPR